MTSQIKSRTKAKPTPRSEQDHVGELLLRTRVARGLPAVVEDPAAIAKIAAIVAERGGR